MDSQNYGEERKIKNIKSKYNKAIEHLQYRNTVDINRSGCSLNGLKRQGQSMRGSCCSSSSFIYMSKIHYRFQDWDKDNSQI
jgi:hypothetical protein